jgi:hypothetical protein
MTIKIHETQFHRNRDNPALCRAVCTCGWFKFGPLGEIQTAAATHDMEWEPVEAPVAQPAVPA